MMSLAWPWPWPRGKVGTDARNGLLVRLLQRAAPLRRLPVWGRCLITTALVLACLQLQWLLDDVHPYPYLIFLPAVVLAAFVFNRGSGFFATFLSGALALYYFVEPRGSFMVDAVGTALSILLYLLAGVLIASVIEALRTTAEELAEANRELRERRAELRHSVNRLETVIEGAPDPIYLKDTEGLYALVNAAAVAMFGTPKDAIIGRRDRDFLPPGQAEQIEEIDRSVVENRISRVSEEERPAAGRGMRWHLVTRSPWYTPDGGPAGVIGIARDIHELKLTQQELQAANEQQALLLTDINHRIKNHLQSLIAVISASRRQKPEGDVGEILQSMIGRIMVLARAYDRFEIKDGPRTVLSISDYVHSLVDDIGAVALGARPIAITVDVADLEIDPNRAVTVGLIVNEAMTNSLKHAFPEGRAGSIVVRLQEDGDSLVLRVSDNGVGLPAEDVGGSTGQWLMQAMAQQLGGSIDREGPPGAAVVVRFPR